MPARTRDAPELAPSYISVANAARILSVSEVSIRRAITDGRLPCRRLGRKILIRYEDLDALIGSPSNQERE